MVNGTELPRAPVLRCGYCDEKIDETKPLVSFKEVNGPLHVFCDVGCRFGWIMKLTIAAGLQ